MTMEITSNNVEEVYYRGAIALNNIGVDLLHRHFYPQAAATLRDAVRCMNAHRAMRLQKRVSLDVYEMLQNANHRLAVCSTPLAYEQSYDARAARRHQIVDFRVGCPLLVSGLLHHNQGLLSLLCPFRVDDCDNLPTMKTTGKNGGTNSKCDDSFEYNTAAFVLNMGFTYLCMAERGQATMHQAVSLFELSFSILNEFCSSRETVLGAREVAQLQLVVILGLMRVKSQITTQEQTHSKLTMPVLQGRLQELVSFIQSSEKFHSYCTQGLNCAAAA